MDVFGEGLTDMGLVRQNNEDAFFCENKKIRSLPNLYIVADGMGGHNAGEVASSKAIEYFKEYLKKNAKKKLSTEQFLKNGVIYANSNVFKMSNSDQELKGMGTMFSVCSADENNFYFAHIGDSRIYIIKGNTLSQITEDHTYVNEMLKSGQITPEEAHGHPKRNLVTRALGTEVSTIVDCGLIPLENMDFFLLCSDGLTDMVTDDLILGTVISENTVSYKLQSLVNLAKENGGNDNITVILAAVNK